MGRKLYNIVNKEVLKQQILEDVTPRTTISFYKYLHIHDVENYRDRMYAAFDDIGVLGRIYVAKEGVNGQMSIPTANVDLFVDNLQSFGFERNHRLNLAIEDDGKSFYKLTIKVRHKILADGLNDDTFDVTNRGIHLTADAFNEITDRDDTVLIDMRNHYESEVGHFEGAITPDVENFRDSLEVIRGILQEHKEKNIVMYCTGGIRCEKASAYFKHVGFENVYQLEGGIIEYTRKAKQNNLRNKYKGVNFVFDERMAERISVEVISKCHQCGEPSDHHLNCHNDACHLLFLQCQSCAEMHESCCSEECKDFKNLPEDVRDEQKKHRVFNGTNNNKGHFPRG